MFFAMTMIPSLLLGWLDDDGTFVPFLISMSITLIGGATLAHFFFQRGAELTHRDGFMLVALIWGILSVAGSLPFYLAHTAGVVDALFESVSGLTTTGATVLSGLDQLPRAINFWRCMEQWLGGMGIIVLAVAILPLLGIGGMQLFKAEMPGVKKDKIGSRIAATAKILWMIYLGLTLAEAGLLMALGVGWFDAICHAFTTVSLGGFSTHDASVGYFDNPWIHWLLVAFMVLAGISFAQHFMTFRVETVPVRIQRGRRRVWLQFLAFIVPRWVKHNPTHDRQGVIRYIYIPGLRFAHYWQSLEFRVYILLLASLVAIATLWLWNSGVEWHLAMRQAALNVVSLATTTGYASTDFSTWPSLILLLMVCSSFVGGMAGSTSGGMKVLRLVLIVKQGLMEIRRVIHPRALITVRVEGRVLDNALVQGVWGFYALFISAFLIIAALVAASGADLITAVTASSACLTNAAVGLGDVGPAGNYAGFEPFAKLALMVGMVLGRLEIFTLVVLLNRDFWRG